MIYDGASAFNAHEGGKLVLPVSANIVLGGESHRHLVGMPSRLLIDAVNQIHRPSCVVALELRLDPDGKELRPRLPFWIFPKSM